jgi:hypothetical protein
LRLVALAWHGATEVETTDREAIEANQ